MKLNPVINGKETTLWVSVDYDGWNGVEITLDNWLPNDNETWKDAQAWIKDNQENIIKDAIDEAQQDRIDRLNNLN